MAFLITCAGCKRKPQLRNPSDLESLSFNDTLNDARKELLELTKIELNWEFTLPAWQLYSGNRSRLYPQVSEDNWSKDCIDVRILSALFGWVKHTDLLPCYNLKMKDAILATNQRVYQFWQKQNLLTRLVFQDDIDLLSGEYRLAIHRNRQRIATIPNTTFTDRGVQKGKWLNEQLKSIQCS